MELSPTLRSARGDHTARRIAESVLATSGPLTGPGEFHSWFAAFAAHTHTRAERVPLDELAGWRRMPGTGDLVHDSGKFFRVEGLEVQIPRGPIPQWDQPIIDQPEVGVLGILVKEFDGVLHCLMQAKAEPGNHNGLQLSPTVQATRSNYTRVHGGRSVPYLDHFRDAARHHVIVDARQSEQGSWFRRKRNRNMVVEVVGDVERLEGFRWLTLGQVQELLAVDDLVNMDARTVLSCLPLTGGGVVEVLGGGGDGFRAALLRSCGGETGGRHTTGEVLSWITEQRSGIEVRTRTVPLGELQSWHHTGGRISHERELFFDVVGVSVQAAGREIGHWMQPMIEPRAIGLAAFLVTSIDGVLHALVHARVEPGFVDVAELAPTVQCTPDVEELLGRDAMPLFLDEVRHADPARIRFDVTMSEEGGRFYAARTRYTVVEVGADERFEHPDYRWVTLHQVSELLRHSHYLNVQARTLVACLHSLVGTAG